MSLKENDVVNLYFYSCEISVFFMQPQVLEETKKENAIATILIKFLLVKMKFLYTLKRALRYFVIIIHISFLSFLKIDSTMKSIIINFAFHNVMLYIVFDFLSIVAIH